MGSHGGQSETEGSLIAITPSTFFLSFVIRNCFHYEIANLVYNLIWQILEMQMGGDFDEDDEAKPQQRWKPLKQRDIMMMVMMKMVTMMMMRSKQIMMMMQT